jgi:UPF0271 protein
MGFGRRAMAVTPDELKDYICYQMGALREFARAAGAELQHMKTHGILYDMMEKDEALARAAAQAVLESAGKEFVMVALAGGQAERCGRALGIRVAAEGFADRAYNADGTLVSRRLPGALIADPEMAAAQAVRMATEGKVRTIDGADIALTVHTICCHGDTPGAPAIVRAVRQALERSSCRVRPMREIVSLG